MRNEYAFEEVFSIVKGVALALGISLVSVVVFAFVLRSAALPQGVIYPVNCGIKVLSVAVGAAACIRGEKGWCKGCVVGLLFTAFSYLAFSAIGGDFSLSWLLFAEVALGAVAGMLGGIIGVNLQK